MPSSFDVAVIGGGVMGCSALHYLAKLGVTNTVLLERDGLAEGSTGRSMAILRMHYSNVVTTQMAWWSRGVIAEFEQETGHPGGFVNTGYLFLVKPDHEEALRRNVELGQRHGVETEYLTPDEAQHRWPDIRFEGVGAVAHERLSGYADSSAVTSGFARRARSEGAQVRLGAEVTAIKTHGGRAISVELGDETISCGAVLIAAGPWIPEFLESLGAPLPLSWARHQVIRIHRPLDLIPMHPTVGDSANGLSFRPDSGDTTLIGAREDPVHRDSYTQTPDGEVVVESLTRLAARVPAMEEAGWDGGWAGLFTVTPDWHPVIDRVPGYDNVYVAAGFSGHGFKLSPAIGRALAEMIVNGESTSIDVSKLRFNRFAEDDLLQSAYGRTVFA